MRSAIVSLSFLSSFFMLTRFAFFVLVADVSGTGTSEKLRIWTRARVLSALWLTIPTSNRVQQRAADGGPSADDALAALGAESALGRMVSEDDVARAALFLASDLSNGITGQILPVDAGLP